MATLGLRGWSVECWRAAPCRCPAGCMCLDVARNTPKPHATLVAPSEQSQTQITYICCSRMPACADARRRGTWRRCRAISGAPPAMPSSPGW